MKKLIYLSIAVLTFATQGAAIADDDDFNAPVVQSFCQQYGDITDSQDAINLIQSFIAESDGLTMQEFMSLSSIVSELQDGDTLQDICES